MTTKRIWFITIGLARALLSPSAATAEQTPTKEAGALQVSISVDPEKLVLGESDQATIRLRVEGISVTSAEDVEIRLQVNPGKISKMDRVSPVELTAVYQPPEEFFPQLAIIAAVVSSRSEVGHGWTVLPLWGTGQAEVFSQPQAQVTVLIGESSFGPVRADKNGHALIPIVVPPGIRNALSSGRQINLKLPPINRIAAIAEPTTLIAGSGQQAEIRCYAVTEVGEPAREVAIRLQADRGAVSPPRAVEAGVYRASYTPPQQVGDGPATVSVSIEGDQVSRDQLVFRIVPGDPARLAVRAEPNIFSAGQSEPIRVTVELFDLAGNPALARVSLESDIGKLGPIQPAGPGRYQAELSLPNSFGNKKQVQIRASVGEKTQASPAEARVTLQAAAPTRIQFAALPKAIVADGKTTTDVQLTILDPFGNPVPKLKPKVSVLEGSVPVVAEIDPGRYTIRYLPPRRRTASRVRLQVSVPGATAEAELELQDQADWLVVSPQVGYLTNFGHLQAPYFSGQVGLYLPPLPYLGRGFSLLAECGYYFSDGESAEAKVSSSFEVIPLTAAIAYEFWVHDLFRLSAAVGGGPFFTSNRTATENQPGIERRATILGMQATAGVGILLGPGVARLQLRYTYAEASGIEELTGNLGGLALLLGYQLSLF